MTARYGYIHRVYIADGFADDCEEIIHRCSKIQTLTYLTFTEIWKDMNFANMYQGRNSGAEIAELSEEFVYIAKHYMVADTSNYEESVAGLFLVYALLNLQPFPKFASLRLTPEDVVSVSRIELVARRERRLDVLYALGAVLVRDTQYHADHRERGMEASLRKYLEGYTTIDSMGVRPKGVFYRQNEELDIIRELNNVSRRYNDAKAAITAGKGDIDRNLNYCDPDLSKNLASSLKMIINGIISDDEESEPADHYSSVQAIKARAMKETVNPIKHLTGVQERRNLSPKKKSPIAKPVCESPKPVCESPKPVPESPKPAKSSPRKRKTSPKKRKGKKRRDLRKTIIDDSDTEDEILDLIEPQKESEKGLDLSEFEKDLEMAEQDEANATVNVIVENNQNECNEQEINIEIDSLPVLIRTTTEDELVEIEIIDNYNNPETSVPQEQNLKDKLLSMPDVTIHKVPGDQIWVSTNDKPKTDMARLSKIPKQKDDHVFKKPEKVTLKRTEKREQKKPILKSKFKRMGILPVANFEDTK